MKELTRGHLKVRIYDSRALMGDAAADAVSGRIREVLSGKDTVNVVFAAAPSQNEFLDSLSRKDVEWSRVNAFHMDEYVGLDGNAPQLFGNFLKARFFGKVPLREIHYMNGSNGLEEECQRYANLLARYPTDIVILGIGENTHLAFNDPHVADFNDPKVVKIVDLDEKNRWQQVDPNDENCFEQIEQVPTHAITLTIPALFGVKYAYAIAPGIKKADAIYHTLNAEVQEQYPSTILRTHANAVLYVDNESASRL